MYQNVSTIERAFELAASGRFLTVGEIRMRLQWEGYRHELVEGPFLAKRLIAAIEKARAARTISAPLVGSNTTAVNKSTGDNARNDAVKKRSLAKSQGDETWTKLDKKTGAFMDQKKAPAKKLFKGVRKEKKR
jgi:hypothetical protein